MDGEYRKRDGDEIVEPLFAALHPEEPEPDPGARVVRVLLAAALLAGLGLGAWFLAF